MKLFIKRNISADDSVFDIYDELGNEKFNVKLIKTKASSSLVISDINGIAISKIKKITVGGSNTFVFRVPKKNVTLVTLFSSNSLRCHYYGKNWHIQGDVLTKKFSVYDVDKTLVYSQNKTANAIELNINDALNELYCISTSVCIEMINTIDKLATQTV